VLLQNGSTFAQWPVKRLGGAACSERQQWGRHERRNWFWSGAAPSRYLGFPSGYGAGKAWIMPQWAGAIASRNEAQASITATANAAAGLNASGTSGVSVTASAYGQLISSASGSATLVFSAGSSISAAVAFAATSSVSFSAAATMGGIGRFSGAASFSLSGTAINYATGTMNGSTIDTSTITSASVAAAVWDSSASAFNTSGSMGQKLNNAASGGVDYAALSDAVWSHSDANAVQTMLLETWGRLGLDKDKPLITGQTQISFGQIVMAMTEAASQVVVVRQ
jgi:hypothetical protein